jgi:hypothetical protein
MHNMANHGDKPTLHHKLLQFLELLFIPFYLSAGIWLLVSNLSLFALTQTYRLTLAAILIFYSIYRSHSAYKKYFKRGTFG